MAASPKPAMDPYYLLTLHEDDFIDAESYLEELPPSPRRTFIDLEIHPEDTVAKQ